MKIRKLIISLAVVVCLLESYYIAVRNENLYIDNLSLEKKPDVKIFISYHKPFPILKGDVFEPIQVGKVLSSKNLEIKGDDTGDNISAKNPYFCELTATYWIWKNSTADYAGLFHYRRFLNFKPKKFLNEHTVSNDFLKSFDITKKDVLDILSEFDIILPYKWNMGKSSVYKQYADNHVAADLDCALDIIREKYGSEIYELAQSTLKNNFEGYFGNILITSKKIFDEYASWLFDILFKVEKHIQSEVNQRDTYQQRVYGFLSERLMTVFIAIHPELKVKELPILFLTENRKAKKKKWLKKYILNELFYPFKSTKEVR